MLALRLRIVDNLSVCAPSDFLRGYPARAEGGLVNAVIEIPTGTCEKWEVKSDGVMRWDMKGGKPRLVQYLGYPCNYGIFPRRCSAEIWAATAIHWTCSCSGRRSLAGLSWR